MPVAIIRFVAKRLLNNRALISATAFGLLVTVTLVTSVPLYAEGISGLLLQRELRKPIAKTQPASSGLIRHRESDREAPTRAADYRAYDSFFRDLIPDAVGLPTTQLQSYVSTGRQGLLDITEDENVDLGASPRRFGYAYLFSVDGFFDNVNVVEGRRPSAQTDTFLGRGGASMPLLEGVMSGSALDLSLIHI